MFHGFIQLLLAFFIQWSGHTQCSDKNKVKDQYIVKIKNSHLSPSEARAETEAKIGAKTGATEAEAEAEAEARSKVKSKASYIIKSVVRDEVHGRANGKIHGKIHGKVHGEVRGEVREEVRGEVREHEEVNHFRVSPSQLTMSYKTLVIETRDIDGFKEELLPEYVQQDCYVESFSLGSDPLSVYQNWYLESLNANENANENENENENFTLSKQQDVVVAVVDAGVDIEHEDLEDNIWVNSIEAEGIHGFDDDDNGFIDDVYGYDVADNDNDPIATRHDFYLDFDHGTHVAGLIGAQYNNQIGIMGITRNQVKIMAVKAFKSQSRTPLSDLLKGIYYAVDNGAHIINASWGVIKPAEQAEKDAINYALAQEVLVVAAAGNTTEPASWVTPASIPGVITVGSLNSQDQLSTFSNYGASINFVGPGGDGSERFGETLISTVIENEYYGFKGTSMATPLITGSIALLMSQRSDMTPYMALKALNTTSSNLKLKPYVGKNEQIYRKINLKQALNYMREHQNIKKLNPKSLTVINDLEKKLLTRQLSSNLNSRKSRGCELQPSNSNKSGIQAHSIIVTLFLTLPSILTLWFRKKKKEHT